jgi:hypothetical protein
MKSLQPARQLILGVRQLEAKRMDDCGDEAERFTQQEALAIARVEALRDLTVSDDAIRYVAFVPDFDDFCECEFLREEEGWFKVVGLLESSKRLPVEEITDERIIHLAQCGKKVSAIRMYRAKHKVGLLEGKLGIEALHKREQETGR